MLASATSYSRNFWPTAMSDSPIGGEISRSSGIAHGATSVSNSFTCVRLCAVDFVMWALYPPEQTDRIGVTQGQQIEPGVVERLRQRRFRVTAVVAQFRVERAVRRLHGRDENQHASVRNQHVLERPQRTRVVVDVLEDVHADHRVETVPRQLAAIAFLQMAGAQHEARLPAHGVLQPADAVDVGLEAHHQVSDLRQRSAHRTDTGSDFEHSLADVRAKQIEQMRTVPACRLHRLEIVGGVLLLGLGVASIDVIGVRHVLRQATITN